MFDGTGLRNGASLPPLPTDGAANWRLSRISKQFRRNCLENSLRRLSAPLWRQEAPELGLLPPLLAALGAPIRDLSRISKQFRKGNSQKSLSRTLHRSARWLTYARCKPHRLDTVTHNT